MSSTAESSTGRRRWSRVRRLSSVLMLGTSLLSASAPPALARRGRGAAAGRSSGRAVSTPRGSAAGAHHGAAVSTPRGNAAVVHQGRAVSTPHGTAYVGHTAVRAAPRPYTRAPYAHGGHRYYAYNPYVYHRYTPYYWGPAYHPVGVLVATVAATAIIVSVANHQYHYDQGVWYVPSGGKYEVVPAPVGATVSALPSGAVSTGNNEYYYGGAYYQKTSKGYTVVAPQAGTVVAQLPPGGQEVTVGDQKYVKFGETYYQPIEQGGQAKYEVVEVK
jgi:hypothetical protein